jgi:hypothetical protein
MKKKKHNKLMKVIIIFAIFVLISIVALNLIVWRMDEDTWIKNSNGIWTRHGNPSETPSEVKEQQQVITCAKDIYYQFKKRIIISSQCLGACGNYSIDIVHVPRTAEDDKTDSQCEDYLNGETSHFIELDKEGNVVRII